MPPITLSKMTSKVHPVATRKKPSPDTVNRHAALAAQDLEMLAEGMAYAKRERHPDVGPSAAAYLAGWRVGNAQLQTVATRASRVASRAKTAIATLQRSDRLDRRLVAVRDGYHVVELFEVIKPGLTFTLCWIIFAPDGSFVSASGSEMLAMESLEQTEVSDKPVGIQDADTGRPNAASDNSVYDTEPWENK